MTTNRKNKLYRNGFYHVPLLEIVFFFICITFQRQQKVNTFVVSSLCFGASNVRHHPQSSLRNSIVDTSFYEALRCRALTCKYGTTTNRASFTSSSLSSSSSSRISSDGMFNSHGKGAFNHSATSSRNTNTILWDVYICESKQCKERGSAETFGAFVGLAPPHIVAIHPAIIQKPKGKGPNIRCVQRKGSRAFEVNNVDSVEKVHRILTKHMNVKGVDPAAYESLRWNYKGNSHLEKGEISQAIQCYDRALDANYKEQEGVLLVMRATAYLQRAYNHRKELKVAVQALEDSVPDPAALQALFSIAAQQTSLVNPIIVRFVNDFKVQNKKFQQTKFRHGLYEYALLHATQDSLRATQLLPRYAMTWMRAGDSLAELRKLKESIQYYEKALQLDPSLTDTLKPTIARLKASQSVLDTARQDGYSEDALRVALDVLG